MGAQLKRNLVHLINHADSHLVMRGILHKGRMDKFRVPQRLSRYANCSYGRFN